MLCVKSKDGANLTTVPGLYSNQKCAMFFEIGRSLSTIQKQPAGNPAGSIINELTINYS